MEKGARGGFGAWIAALATPEKLEDLPEIKPDPDKESFLSWLLKPEELPSDPVASSEQPKAPSSRLLASETLPLDEAEGPRVRRPPFLSILFSREQLPCDPVPDKAKGRRGGAR